MVDPGADRPAAGNRLAQDHAEPVALRLLGAIGLIAALGCALVGVLTSDRTGGGTGLWISGVSAVFSGALVTLCSGSPRQTFRVLLGCAVALWGIGELVLAVDHLVGGLDYPAPGDAISALAAPLGGYALIRAPSSSRSDWPGVRLGIDSLLMALGVTLLLWRTMLVSPGDVITSGAVVSGVICLGDSTILGFVLLVCLRDPRCRLWPAVGGVFCHVLADLITVFLVGDGSVRILHWQAMALWSVAWPLIAIGLIRYRRSTPTADSDGTRDRQDIVAAQLTGILTFLAVVVAMVLDRPAVADARALGGLALFVVLALLLLSREMISSYLRLRLTGRLRAQAFRDALTGLPNRRALIERITELHRGSRPWVVLTLDLDGFKEINDLLGQGGGDRLLIAAAGALREHGPAEVMVARIGADEFAVLSPGGLTDGVRLAERLQAVLGVALEQEIPGSGMSASVGVGRVVPGPPPPGEPDDDDRVEGLSESAAALAAARAAGRNSVAVHTAALAAQRERRLRLEQRLRQAISAGSVHTVAQPIVDLADGHLTGLESLARWDDEELGPVPPEEFIAVAEQTGMVVALGEQLIRQSLTEAVQAGVFRAGLTLALNASPIQLRAPGFVDLVRQQLELLRIPSRQVIVEITEAILVDEGDPAITVLADLRSLGVELAIDDFGTGYSALGYLRRLPVQVLKIDKSLTRSLNCEPKTLAIVDGVVGMAHRLGIRVVMEGIEDEREARVCRSVGADRGQGWLYGQPMPWSMIADLVCAPQEGVDLRDHTGPALSPVRPARTGP